MGILLIGSFVLSLVMLDSLNYFFAIATGVVVGTAIGMITEWYTSDKYKHVRQIAEQSKTGAATNILAGLSIGMKSTALPVILIAIAVIISVSVCGLFGVALVVSPIIVGLLLGKAALAGLLLGATVGDPLKDTAGPSLNILIKLMSIVALVFAPLFL